MLRFSWMLHIILAKLCMMMALFELYLFIQVLLSLTLLQGRSSIEQLKVKAVFLSNILSN